MVVELEDEEGEYEPMRPSCFSAPSVTFIAIVACALVTVHASAREDVEPWALQHEKVLVSAIDDEVVDVLKLRLGCTEEQARDIERLYHAHRDRFSAFAAESKSVKNEMDQEVDSTYANMRSAAQRLSAAKVELHVNPERDPQVVAGLEAEALEAARKLLDLRISRETKLAEIADQQADLDEGFFAELATQLSDEQVENLPGVRCTLKRLAWGAKPGIYGEMGIDLIDLVEKTAEELQIQIQNDELAELLTTYEQRLVAVLDELAHEAIQYSRRKYRDHHEAGHFIPMPGSIALEYSHDPKYIKELERQRAAIQRRYRENGDLNRDTMPAVLELLPEQGREHFRSAHTTLALRSYVRLDAMPGVPFAEMAYELESLTAQQKLDIKGLMEAHVAESPMHQDRILRSGDAWAEARFDMTTAMERRESLERRFQADIEAYRKAEENFIGVVWSLLTPDQQSQLQKPALAELPR